MRPICVLGSRLVWYCLLRMTLWSFLSWVGAGVDGVDGFREVGGVGIEVVVADIISVVLEMVDGGANMYLGNG